MKCQVCQQEVRDDARFCPICGAKQEPVPVPPIEPEVIPEPQVISEPVVEEVPVTAEPEAISEPIAEEAPAAEEIPQEAVFETAPAEPLEYKYDPSVSYSAGFQSQPQSAPEPAPVAQPKYEYVPQAPVMAAPVYQTVYQQVNTPQRPAYQLPDRRSLLKMIFLGLITCGIYNVVVMSRIAEEVNMVASKHDGKRTQQFFWMYVLTCLTFGIYAFVWMHGLCNRIGGELKRRGLSYKFGAFDFWLWNFLVSLVGGIAVAIVAGIVLTKGASILLLVLVYLAATAVALVGPFIFTHKFCKASNLMNRDYNLRG